MIGGSSHGQQGRTQKREPMNLGAGRLSSPAEGQENWDQAMQEIEAEGPETERGATAPMVGVGSKSTRG